MEFGAKNVQTPNNKVFRIQIWDTAGQETFRSIIKSGIELNRISSSRNFVKNNELEFYIDKDFTQMGYYVVYLSNITKFGINIENYTITYDDKKVNVIVSLIIKSLSRKSKTKKLN